MFTNTFVRHVVRVMMLCTSFLLCAQGEAYARGYRHNHPVINLDPKKFEEIKCAAMNAYFESNDDLDEMFVSQFMISFVAKHRADEARTHEAMRLPFVGKLIEKAEQIDTLLRDHAVCMVVYEEWQFSWTMSSVCGWCQKWIHLQDVPTSNGFKWESAQYAAQMVNEGWGPRHIGLDRELSRATHYFNPDATSAHMTCWFRQVHIRLAQGKRIGKHEFYAFPTGAEKEMMRQVHSDSSRRCDPVDTKNP